MAAHPTQLYTGQHQLLKRPSHLPSGTWHPPLRRSLPMLLPVSRSPPLSQAVGSPCAVIGASQSRAEAGQASLGHEHTSSPERLNRAEPPQCRKWLDFTHTAPEDTPRPLQPGTLAGGPKQTHTLANKEPCIEPGGRDPPPEQDGVRQQHVKSTSGGLEPPSLPRNGETAVQTSHAVSTGEAPQGKGGDAELMIGGVLTRWTKVRNYRLPEECACSCELCMDN